MKKIIELIKKVINNDYLFSIISKFSSLFVAIALSVFMARFFGSELKGIIAVIDNDVSLYSVFLGLGIYQSYPFFRKKEPDITQTYLNNISTLFLILETLAIIIGITMIIFNVNLYFAIAILLIPISSYIKQLNYIVLCENARRRSMSALLISISEVLVLAILWLLFSANVKTAIAFSCATYLINFLISFANLKMNPLKIRPQLNRIVEFAKFGIIPMLVYLCMTINYRIDIQMLKWYSNVTYADIGIYSIGVSLASKLWLIPDAIKDILLSKLVRGKNENEVAKVIRINLAICVLAAIMLILFGKPIITFLYGKDFTQVYYVMVLLVAGMIGMIFYKMVYSYNIAQGKRTINLIFLGSAAICNILGNLVLIPLFGIWGAAIMSVISYIICGLCFLVYFHLKSNIRYKEILIIKKQDIENAKFFFKNK